MVSECKQLVNSTYIFMILTVYSRSILIGNSPANSSTDSIVSFFGRSSKKEFISATFRNVAGW